MGVRKSPIYDHFITQSNGDEKCKHCSVLIKYVQSSNLEKHLRTAHSEEWKQYSKDKDAASKQSTPKKRKLDVSQPEFSFTLPKKELPKSEVERLDKEAILIGSTPGLPLNIIKKHQTMMKTGYKVSYLF